MSPQPTEHLDPRPSARRPKRRLAALAALVGVLALGAAMPAGSFAATPGAATADGSTAATTTTCTAGAWPYAVQGAPVLVAGSAAGIHIWHNATGFHLRVTHPGTYLATFSGTIRANKPLHVTGYLLESGDSFSVAADGLSATYRFANHGHLDGIDFTTACATRLGVSSRMNRALLPVRRIWLGHAGRHPLQNPFAIYRRA